MCLDPSARTLHPGWKFPFVSCVPDIRGSWTGFELCSWPRVLLIDTNIFQSAYISGHVLSAFCLYHLIQSLPQLLKVGAINICILQARGSRHLGWKELVRTTQLGRGGAGVETESTSRLHSPTHRAVPPLQSLFKYVFIRWPGLSCSMQGLLVVACKMQCPGQGSTPCTGTQCRAQSLSHWTPREVPQLTF